jgi:hypothetical protein
MLMFKWLLYLNMKNSGWKRCPERMKIFQTRTWMILYVRICFHLVRKFSFASARKFYPRT